MAYTQLSLTATPGRPYTGFSAKSVLASVSGLLLVDVETRYILVKPERRFAKIEDEDRFANPRRSYE